MRTSSGTASGASKALPAVDVVDAQHYQELKERLAKATARRKNF